MAPPRLSQWSTTSDRSTQRPGDRNDIFYSLQKTLLKVLSFCHNFWHEVAQKSTTEHDEESLNTAEEHMSFGNVPSGKVRIMNKPLPPSPLSVEPVYMPQAPPPLVERRYLGERPASLNLRQRPISWSEDQINTLQEENRKLRRQIISQKRIDADKDRIIATLRQQNCQINLELGRQHKALTKLASMAVAIQSSGHLPLSRPESASESLDHGAIDEIVQFYSNLPLVAGPADCIQRSGRASVQSNGFSSSVYSHPQTY